MGIRDKICDTLVNEGMFPDIISCLDSSQPQLREKAASYIHKRAGSELTDEINYQLEVEREKPYNTIDGFEDILDRIDEGDYPRSLTRNAREIGIALGIWREISEEELEEIATFRLGRPTARKKYDFIQSGKKHVWERHLSDILKGGSGEVEHETRIWQEELGGIRHIWVRLPNRSAVQVGSVDENLSDDEIILRAKRYWEHGDKIEKASAILRAEYPEQAIVCGDLPQPDTSFLEDAGEYCYVLSRRKREGKYVVERAIKVGG